METNVVSRYISKRMSLSQERAKQRSAVLRKNTIKYDFYLALKQGTNYQGLARIEFQIHTIPDCLHIDFNGYIIKGLIVNQQPVQDLEPKNKGFITLEKDALNTSINEVWVYYQNQYDNDGSGCVSYIDEIDKRQYLYTHFEPYTANKVFPCFDQPDLKAQMNLTVIAPPSWTVLSNQLSKEVVPLHSNPLKCDSPLYKNFALDLSQTNFNVTYFPTSKIILTYLFAFTAGEYFEVKVPEERTIRSIPMSNFCMQSSKDYLLKLSPFIMELTLEAVKFYEQFFNYPYPFPVYHQVWVHQFKFRAMENAGLVVFDDFFLYKEEVSASKMYDLADTVTHQISHHWFGNLVTMEWWDDLWLNESFAFFISHLCNESIKDKLTTYKFESITAGFVDMKGWGYQEDKRNLTTHPIRGPVESTGVALANFDGITYTKGASAIKQLMSLIGLQHFSKAVSTYFHKYEWKNATIDDFLSEISAYLPDKSFSLEKWVTMWLQTPSLNVLEPIWKQEDHSSQAKLIIRQKSYSKDNEMLRYHKIKIAFFDKTANIAEIKEVLVLPQPETEVIYDGSKRIKAILLNYEDWSFIENVIDVDSLNFFCQHINNIQDILTRTIIWSCLFSMVNEGHLTVFHYTCQVLKVIFQEPSLLLLDKQLNNLYSCMNNCMKLCQRNEIATTVFLKIINELEQKKDISPQKELILKDKLIAFAKSEESIKLLLRWKDKTELQKYQLNQEHKWNIVLKAATLTSLTKQQKQLLFKQQKEEENSISAIDNRYTFEALVADQAEFQAIYEKAKSREVSVAIKKLYALGWRHECHLDKLLSYKKRFFKDVEKASEELQGDHLAILISGFSPMDDDVVSQIEGFNELSYQLRNKQNLIEIWIGLRKTISDLEKRYRNYEFNSV